MFSGLNKRIRKKTKAVNEYKKIKDRELTKDEKKELEALEKDLKKLKGELKLKIAQAATRKAISLIVSVISTICSAIAALGSTFFIVLIVIVLLVTVIAGVMSTTLTTNGVFTPDIENRPGAVSKGAPGARYEFNKTDMGLLSSNYEKNIYMLAWLWTNVKQMSNDEITLPITNALGETIYEYGTSFFQTYTYEYEDNNLINEVACGFPSGGGVSQVCQGLYQCNTRDFNTDALNYWKRFGYTSLEEVTAAAWGTLEHEAVLKAPEGLNPQVYNGYEPLVKACANNNYTATVHDAAYQVMYAGYINGFYRNALTTGNGGHTYTSYYQSACKAHGLDASDKEVHDWFLSSLAYVFHAGSMRGSFTNNSNRDAACTAVFDYLAYVYKNYYMGKGWDAYNADAAGDWGSPKGVSNKYMLENAYNYTNYASAGKAAFGKSADPYGASKETYMRNSKGELVLSNNMAYMWYNSLNKNMRAIADIILKVFNYDGSVVTNKYPGSQGAYAHIVGWASSIGGTSRLNAVFEQLDIEWTLDSLGYICYAQLGIPVTTTGVNPAIVVDTFDTSKPSYWQKDWFKTIDESEWSLPIDFGEDGGKSHISSLFGYRDYNNNEFHCGLDMLYNDVVAQLNAGAYDNIPIYAMHSGEIINITHNNKSCGNYVMYECTWRSFNEETGEWGYKTGRFLCMHMSKVAENLAVGDKIKTGQIIGYMGNTGGVAAHLHLQMSTTGVNRAIGDSGIRNMVTELPFFTWLTGYQGYVERKNSSGGYADGRLNGKPIDLGWSNEDGTNADTATNSDEHP